MIPANLVLARRLQVEVQELARSVYRAQRAWQAATRAGADQDLYLDSAALNLHSFYSGVEKVCEVVALQLDGGLPKGEAWHRDLLAQMTLDVPGVRPPVLSLDSVQRLDEYRRFRHVVRNVYAERLDPPRIGELIEKLAPLWDRLDTELAGFAQFLEAVSRADDADRP
jgi:hypothetical protein